MEMEEERGGGEHDRWKADMEGAANGGGDAKRPTEDHDDCARRCAMAMENDDEDLEPLSNPLDAYRESWVASYGSSGRAAFFDETDLPPMPRDTTQVFTVITGDLQWPPDVYGVVAVRDSLDHKRNVLFRRCRDDCQTLT